MLSHPPGRHHTEGGDDTGEGGRRRGGDDIRGHHRGWDNMWCPPCRPPSPVSSPPSVWCLPGGSPPWDNMWCLLGALWCPPMSPLRVIPPRPCRPPLQCGVSQEGGTTCSIPVRRPPLRVVPPRPCRPPLQCGVSQEGGTTCGIPVRRPPPPRRPPLARVVPPFSVVSPRRVGQHVVSPCVVPPSASSPPLRVVPPRNLARYVVPPLLQMRFQAKKTSNLKSRAAENPQIVNSTIYETFI